METMADVRFGVHFKGWVDIVRVIIVVVAVVRANQVPQSFFRESSPRRAGVKRPTWAPLPEESH